MKINKKKLIEKIKENKAAHIVAYNEAVKAYRIEAMAQLQKLVTKVESGVLGVRLNLVTPINNSKNYDRVVSMFEWDEATIVELDQAEFKEYVLDETQEQYDALRANNTYLSSSHG